jgi:hypothetical protein
MTDLAPIAAAIERATATPGPDALVPPPADTPSLERQLYRGWWSIVLGIAFAGAVYPVLFVVLGIGFQMVTSGFQPEIFAFAIMSLFAVPYLVAVASFGFGLAGLVMVVALPVVHLVVWSLQPRVDLVRFGAFCGGLVGFVAVVPFFFVIASGGFGTGGPTLGEVITAILVGPAITTVLGQLGGAWGGRRAANWGRTNELELGPNPGTDATSAVTAARYQFGMRHLLWVAMWASLLLTLIRVSGIPFGFALPLLLGWIAYQTATLWIGSLLLPRLAEWWAARQQSRST